MLDFERVMFTLELLDAIEQFLHRWLAASRHGIGVAGANVRETTAAFIELSGCSLFGKY